MATTGDLAELAFTRCVVTARKVDIAHEDPYGRGPFCRLAVDDTAPDGPGVYAWVVDGSVMYVGKATRLRCITQGQKLGSAYNDYTYIPPSQCQKPSDPRVRVNGLINGALGRAGTIEWWWLAVASVDDAGRTEDSLIDHWQPPWNRAGIRPAVSL